MIHGEMKMTAVLLSVKGSPSAKTVGATNYYINCSDDGDPITLFSRQLPKVDFQQGSNGLMIPVKQGQSVEVLFGLRKWGGKPMLDVVSITPVK